MKEIFIPEGFSPNGDGVNDTWHITGIERFPGNHIDIYSRWETKVYEADDYQISTDEWDGTSNINTFSIGNNDVPEGTYFFVIDLGDGKASGRRPVKGYVYIRRSRR